MRWAVLLLFARSVIAEPRAYVVARGGSFDTSVHPIAWRAPGGHCGGDVVHELEQFLTTLRGITVGTDTVAIHTGSGARQLKTLHGGDAAYGFWDVADSTLVIRIEECRTLACEVQISLIHRTGLSQRERLDACYERWIGRATRRESR